jgi:hypothetical protein
MTNLNPTQKDELIAQYVDLLVDSMSMSDLISYVAEDLTNFCDKLTDSELKEEISLTHDEELYEELVDNVRELTTQEQLDYINSNLKEVN